MSPSVDGACDNLIFTKVRSGLGLDPASLLTLRTNVMNKIKMPSNFQALGAWKPSGLPKITPEKVRTQEFFERL